MLLGYALTIGMILLTCGAGFRVGTHQPVTFEYLTKLVLVSFGLGAYAAFSVYPSIALAWGYSQHGGGLDRYLIADPGEIIVGLVVGVLLGTFWAIKGYMDTL